MHHLSLVHNIKVIIFKTKEATGDEQNPPDLKHTDEIGLLSRSMVSTTSLQRMSNQQMRPSCSTESAGQLNMSMNHLASNFTPSYSIPSNHPSKVNCSNTSLIEAPSLICLLQ